ncbi:MAG: endonuclease/exonuclease/phosphatase family protein [Prevotella sp.]|nr:endonuclease/exonuclease/phosphatase family protein [Prevotella sp.]
MIKKLKRLTIQLIGGANIATVIVMLLAGFSDHFYPADHPVLSTIGMAFPLLLLINLLFLFFWVVFKWRMIWIPIAGFFLAYVPISIYMPVNPTQDIPQDALKIISYNVCAYGGNYKYEDGFKAVCDYLRDEQADIVCLQEDVDTWRRYVFKEYSKTYAYNDTVVLVKTSTCFNNLGIHTRFPILRRERIEYPSETNGSVAWWLDVNGDTVIVVNNHFESCHLNQDDRQHYRQILHGKMNSDSARAESKLLLVKLAEANAKRCSQIDVVCQYIKKHSQHAVIVCGDFNDNPISYSRHAMSKVLTDCFEETGRGLGLSYNQKAFSFRIDHLFCSKEFQPYNCKIDSKMDASDHNPLICWLKIRQKEQKTSENSQ